VFPNSGIVKVSQVHLVQILGLTMLIALLTDIHANREALAACLMHAEDRHAERYVFLGDLVGYGGEPGWVVDTVMAYVARGALAVLGNHDAAVAGEPGVNMNPDACKSVEWTRSKLDETQLAFLRNLPLTIEANGCLFVHASAASPRQWEYISGKIEAVRSLQSTQCSAIFCGHVHEPALYNMSETGKVSAFSPVGDSSIPLGARRRWLVIPGAVGQPRDGNPAACYALYDDRSRDLTYFRVPYDCASAASKIRRAGLSESFAVRLETGA
jgi:diadenosine tetraphosphatase ApaH/serine/threonine PP2A family protein phosphatase